MTFEEKNHLLNTYQSEVLELKSFLYSTDYQTIREAEGGEPMSDEVRTKRSASRTRINELQDLISQTEAIEPELPEFPEFPENPDATLGEEKVEE